MAEPSEFHFPKGQSWVFDVADVLIPNLYSKKGICFGYENLACQAIVNRNAEGFRRHLDYLQFGPPPSDALSKMSSDKRAELVAIVKEVIKSSKDSFVNTFRGSEDEAIKWIYAGRPIPRDNAISPNDLKSLILISEGIRAHYSHLYREDYYKTIPEEKKHLHKEQADHYVTDRLAIFDKENPTLCALIESQIFMEDMAIYQEPQASNFQEFIENKKRPLYQKDKAIFSLLAPVELDAKKATRMEEVVDSINMYTPEKLTVFFETLEKQIKLNEAKIIEELGKDKKIAELPLALSMMCINHGINIAYNFSSKRWIVNDINNAPAFEVETKNLAKAVEDAYPVASSSDTLKIVIGTRVNIDSSSKVIRDIVENWQNDPAYKAMQTPQVFSANKKEIIDDIFPHGYSELYVAAIRGYTERVKLLLAQGADPYLSLNSDELNTPFVAARHYVRLAIVTSDANKDQEDIKNAFAVYDIINQTGYQRLKNYVAAHDKEDNLAYITGIVNQKNGPSYELFVKAVENKDDALINLLVKGGIINHMDPPDAGDYAKGYPSAIHKAAFHGHAEVMKILIEKKANFNLLNSYRDTAFSIAAAWGRTDVVKLMLDKMDPDTISPTVNAYNAEGQTALYFAVQRGHTEIIKLLLANGADPDFPDFYTSMNLGIKVKPAYEVAKELHKDEITAIILNHRAMQLQKKIATSVVTDHQDPIQTSNIKRLNEELTAAKNDTKACENVINKFKKYLEIQPITSAMLNILNAQPATDITLKQRQVIKDLFDHDAGQEQLYQALQAAVVKGDQALVELFVNAGLDINIQPGELEHHSVLMLACKYNQIGIARFLLDKGANVSLMSEGGISALSYSVNNNNEELFKLLAEKIEPYSDLLTRRIPISLLHQAAKIGNVSIAKILLMRGADVDGYAYVDHGGKDLHAVDVAAANHHQELVTLLQLYKLKKTIDDINSYSKIGYEAAANLKQAAKDSKNDDRLVIMYDTYKMLEEAVHDYFNTISPLEEEWSANEKDINKIIEATFAEALQVKDNTTKETCLNHFITGVTNIKTALVSQKKSQPGFFKDDSIITEIDDILRHFPQDVTHRLDNT